MDCRPPGFSILGILQARILEWVAMPSSRGSSPFREANPLLLHLLNWQAGSWPLAPPGKPSKILTLLVKSRWVSIVPGLQVWSHRHRQRFSGECEGQKSLTWALGQSAPAVFLCHHSPSWVWMTFTLFSWSFHCMYSIWPLTGLSEGWWLSPNHAISLTSSRDYTEITFTMI